MFVSFIHKLGSDSKGNTLIEVMLNKNIDAVDHPEWNDSLSCYKSPPPLNDGSIIISTALDLTVITNYDSCDYASFFTMYDCIDGIIALCWENDPDDFEDTRFVVRFGDSYDKLKAMCEKRNIVIRKTL